MLCVCVPTWNGAPYLERTLKGLLSQQEIDLEVIVGDDASEDDTVAVALGFRDPRVTVHSFSAHLGLAGNWNRLLRLARGKYVAVVGQDDEVYPLWAARLVGLLEVHPEADLAFGRREFDIEDDESRSRLGDFFDHYYPEILDGFYRRIGTVISPDLMLEEAFRHRFEINLIGEPTFVVVRLGSTAVADGFDPSMQQMIDWEFFTRFFVDRPILHCPEPLGIYHIHAKASSITSACRSRHYREYDYLLGVVARRFARRLGRRRSRELESCRDEVRKLGRTLG